MTKTLYLIDDGIKQMITVMNGQFPELWFLEEPDGGVKAKVIIFGNGNNEFFSSELYSEEEEIDFQQKMGDLLYTECKRKEIEYDKKDLFLEKSELIEDAVNILFKKQTEKEQLGLYQDICSYWQKDIKEGAVGQEEKEKVSRLIELMQIEQDACVGIDMVLLYQDIERTKEGKCIISMELYDQLRKNHKCFIYSSTTFDGKFIEKWKETYVNNYNRDEKIEVYKKLEMRRKKHNSYVFDHIKDLLEKEDDELDGDK